MADDPTFPGRPGTPEGLAEPRKARGCLFWGCLVFILVGLAIGGCIGATYYFFMKFTSEKPQPVPVEEVKPGQLQAVEKRIDDCGQALEKDQPATLELTEKDLNTLLAAEPSLPRDLQKKAHVRIEGKQLQVDMSLRVPGDRWFNGTVGLSVGAA